MPQNKVSFSCSPADADAISTIVDRAEAIHTKLRAKLPPEEFSKVADFDYMSTNMDITAVHANGNPLDLQKLLTFDDFSFAHDVFGISRHIDRNTGKLMNCFLPRCSVK